MDRLSLSEAPEASPSLCSSCVTVSSILHRPLNHTLREYLRATSFILWTICSRRLPPLLQTRPQALCKCQTPRVTLEFWVAPWRTQALFAERGGAGERDEIHLLMHARFDY